MNVAPIVSNTVTNQGFKGRKDGETGGTGKALTSTLIPGLGQIVDGRTGVGLGFLGGSIAAFALRIGVSKDATRILKPLLKEGMLKGDLENFNKARQELLKTPGVRAAKVMYIIQMGLWAANIVDAYVGDKMKNNNL